MPAKVLKAAGTGYLIVERGKIVGHSASKKNAQRSANVRNAIRHGWKPKKH